MQKDLAQRLGELPLFSTLAIAPREAIAQVCQVLEASRGEIIIREEEIATRGFYVLLEGTAKVAVTNPEGREAVLAFLEEGDFFGEMSLLDGDPRSATVRAATDLRLLLVRRQEFLDLLRLFPEIAIGILTELSTRLRQANRKISALALSPVVARITGAILQIAELRGMRQRGVIVISERPTQQEIADMANTTRETVSRVLSQMQKEGLIGLDGRQMLILDEAALRGEP
ncbi:MAG: Crp/Fnr family transcriptional regulator [Fibrobacteres bacterium]|nr:Crp/Fnr family transcriptional regulator [Fibrobacterota bacterium]